MQNVKKLLDEAKEKTGACSDYALAKNLDVPKQRVSEYYKGAASPDEFACLKIAEATGRTWEEVTALVKVEAEKNEKRREVWRKKLVSLGGMAAMISTIFFAPVILNMTQTAGNALAASDSSRGNLYYVKLRSALRAASEAVRGVLNIDFRRLCCRGWLSGGILA